MSVWLVRAGSHGEYERKFLHEKRVYLTWDNLNIDLKKLPHPDALFTKMTELYQDAKPKRLHNWVSQVWPFAHSIEKGNLIVLPMKSQPNIYVGEVIPTVDKLLGAMTKFGAQEGLFVAWGGFRSNVDKELAPSFFPVAALDAKRLVRAAILPL